MKITKGSLTKRNGGWWWRYSIDGKRKSKTFQVKTRQQAEAMRDAYLRKLSIEPEVATNTLTIHELCDHFLVFAKSYYRSPDGTQSESFGMVGRVANTLDAQYGNSRAVEFGPLRLKELRDHWVENGVSRSISNRYTGQVKRIFKWAVSEELLPSSIHLSLSTVEGLRKGRSKAKETSPVKPVPESHISAIGPFVSKQIWAVIQLQLLTGARPSELLMLKPINLDTTGKIWIATLEEHKTVDKGQKRLIYFGPNAQAILKDFIVKIPANSYIFSPSIAVAERHSNAPTHRRLNQKSNIRKSNRVVGDHYTASSFWRAITRACDKAEVPRWTPYQLRHNAGTYIRKHYGLEAAQIILGHSKADITQIYAERDQDKALKVIEEIG